MSMTLAEARETVLSGVLHAPAGHGHFGPENVDRAIRFAGNDFAQTTRAIRGTTSVPLTAGSAHPFNIQGVAGMDRFMEENFIWASIGGKAVKQAPLHTVQRYHDGATPTGQPTMLAFEGPSRLWFDKKPSGNMTLTVFWWQPFTSWTIGTSSPSGVILNLPPQYADAVLRFGAATALVYADPRTMYGQQGWQAYTSFRDRVAAGFRPDLDRPVQNDPRVIVPRPTKN